MPKETQTIQCYPNDNEINSTIRQWERWGWELISNQRCQEFVKQDPDGTKHYETFNKLTFSRDKDASWYKELISLEAEYDNVCHEVDREREKEPKVPSKPYFYINLLCALVLLFIFIVPGVIYIAFRIMKYVKEKKDYEAMLKEYRIQHENWKKSNKIKELQAREDEILEKRDALMND